MIWHRKATPPVLPSEPRPTDAGLFDPDAAAWPFTRDSPAVQDVLARGEAVRILLVDATGLDWEQIDPLVPVAREVAAEQRMVLVLLVDLVDFAGLRASGLVYDALPNTGATATLAPDLDWAAYVEWRRRLVHDKWQPAATIRLGEGL